MKKNIKKITVSFKNTKKDIALFNYIMSVEDKSFYIKEAMRQVFSAEIEAELEKLNKQEQETDDIFKGYDLEELNRRIKQDAEYKGEERRQIPYVYKEA